MAPVTLVSSGPQPCQTSVDTPVGQRDSEPKVQACLDFRQKEVLRPRGKSKSIQNVLEVTIMWVRNLPRQDGKEPTPFVKTSLQPGLLFHTTELKSGKTDAQYIETFEYPVDSNHLTGYELIIEVLDKKATRNAKCFGQVRIPLDSMKLGSPICEWFKLNPKE